MKKLYLVILVLSTLIVSCESEEMEVNPQVEEQMGNVFFTANNNRGMGNYPNNEMIVYYPEFTTEADKDQIRLNYGVSNYKQCKCGDPNLELWVFEVGRDGTLLNGLDLEEIVSGAKEDSDLEGVDFNPGFLQDGITLETSPGDANIESALDLRVAQNSDLTIAILDTGIDYNYFGFAEPFLYNTSQSENECYDQGMEDLYGWDFVNQDNDVYDKHGHGTVISHIIYEELNKNDITFQLLPVKVFNDNGKASYFDILCGFKYAVNNSDVDIINMSFGWYNDEGSLLSLFIEESGSDVLITTSAGNLEQNNDFIPHYPSSYPGSNIIATTSLNDIDGYLGLAEFSNYGISSVDIAARGENIPFYITPDEIVYIQGTSFSSAYTVAFSSESFQEGLSPQEFKQLIISKTEQHPNLSTIKYQSYIDY